MINDWNLQVGDDLICSGESLASRAIKRMNHFSGVRGKAVEMTHVATIVKEQPGNIIKVAESTSIGYTGIKGVQVNPFEEWLDNYNGRVWLVQYDFKRTYDFEQQFLEFILSRIGTPYESGIAGGFELLLAGLRLDRFVRKVFPNYNPCSTEKLHCTELDVTVKKYMGMLQENAIASRMPPCQFWPYGELHNYFTSLIENVHLPIQIK